MIRSGKPLTVLPDGHPRRLSDARNAWRKMTPAQRSEFMAWVKSTRANYPVGGA